MTAPTLPILPALRAGPPAAMRPWPASVPTAEEAIEAFAGHARDSASAPFASQLHGELTPEEMRVLDSGGAGAQALRAAQALRLRLMMAQASRPAAGQPIDSAAVEALVSEADALLGVLRAPDEDCAEAFDATRLALTTQAVDFSEMLQGLLQAEATASVEKAAGVLGHKARPRLFRVLPPEQRAQLHQRLRFNKLGVALVALGLLSLFVNLYLAAPPKAANPPSLYGLPPGVISAPIGRSGAGLVTSPDGRPIPAAIVEQARVRAVATGGEVQVLGDKAFVILPKKLEEPQKVAPRGGKAPP
jgi:hypothetical protein